MSKVFNMVGGGGGPAASIFVTGLSETNTVTASNGVKTLTGKWTQKPNPAAHGLPDGYTELEYIESSGTQWIDTELRMPYFRIKATVEVVSFTNAWQLWFGYSYDDCRAYLGLSDTNKFCIGYPISNGYVNNIKGTSVGVDYGIDVSIGQTSATYIVNGDTLRTVSYTASAEDRPIALFADANSATPTASEFNNIRFKGSTQIYNQSDVLVRNFIPSKRNSDSAVGMYDLVNDVFYTNSGTGEFVAGAEIPQTIGGFLIKPIRDLGTWTVTATDGTKTATQDVLVDVITEYEIKMFYGLKIYWDGDAYQPVTAFDLYDARNGTPSVSTSLETDCVRVKQDQANTTSGICSVNSIDLSQYSKLSIEWSKTSAVNTKYSNIRADLFAQNYSGLNIGVNSSGTPIDNTIAYLGQSAEYSDDYTGTHHVTEFDLSEFNQTGYVSCSFWYTSDAKIYKVWLE